MAIPNTPFEDELASHERAIDRVCCEYGGTPPAQLVARLQGQLVQLDRVRGRGTLRRVQAAAGWGYLLLAACHVDLGKADIGWVARDSAEHLGREADDPELIGWAYETASWISLWEGRVHDSLTAAEEGARIAPRGSSAWLMNVCKVAACQARLGRLAEVDRGFHRVEQALQERAREPENPQHHFHFDSPKVHQYASDAYTWLHEAELAERHSRAVIAWAGDPRAQTWNPTRTATAQVNLGLTFADRGELDVALAVATPAFDVFLRRDTVIAAENLDEQLLQRWPRDVAASEFHLRLQRARQALRT